MRNILIMEQERWDALSSHYFEITDMLDVILLTSKDTFKVQKNRNNYNDVGKVHPIAGLKYYTS